MPETRPSSRGEGTGEANQISHNPTHPEPLVYRLRRACRCGARTRAGTPCQSPAIKGRKRCRMHGGRSPGAPKGEANGNYVSGRWTEETVRARALVKAMVKLCRTTLHEIA
ncbi:HGGxSTG domain-containing protein [Brevundimonas sp. VNH65]|uniref:HGGxSTG domain-containing protein n=1 Tax=Brevundimonas sp. VNH65 TaxID=3400917 RepID=UPI003C087513